VTFAGFASDPGPYLRAANVFVLASDFEGFGNVIVEALAAGLPVVCTDALHGPRFIRGDCRAVTLVPRDDPRALADATIKAAQAAGPALAYEAHSRARAFSVERVSAHFDRLVQCVISGAPAPAWSD
jgi:glycosyltransferase involved in cell wall biosynthesis